MSRLKLLSGFIFLKLFLRISRLTNREKNLITSPKTTKKTISIDLLKQGDSREFTHLIRIYQDMVFACCRTVGLREDEIEDAASEAFVTVYKSIGSYSSKSKLSSWLWKIAFRKALDYRKKTQNKFITSADTIETFASLSPLPETAMSKQEQNAVWETVQKLSEPYSAVIVLYYRDRNSVEDIAQILEMPENTVKTCLYRGRKELYNRLKSMWETNYVRE